MRFYVYILARDFGFAPNPFHGYCTLATCKPVIRKHAEVGDVVIGVGGAKYKLRGRTAYMMQVSEEMTFDDYWADPRFKCKRPDTAGSLKVMYGDNIYHRESAKHSWQQEDSHHSLERGRPNKKNIDHDTRVNRILISDNYVYWGASAPKLPTSLSDLNLSRQYLVNHSKETEIALKAWTKRHLGKGYIGEPAEFQKAKPVKY